MLKNKMATIPARPSARAILEEIDMRDLASLIQAVDGTEFDSHVIDEIIETHFNDQYNRLRMLYAYKQDFEAITHEVTKRIGSYLFKYADELRIEQIMSRGEPTRNSNGKTSRTSKWRKI